MVRYVSQRSYAGHQWTKHTPLHGYILPMFDSRLSVHDRAVFAALDYFKRQGNNCPTQKQLKVITGISSPSTLKHSTDWLVQCGWLEVEKDLTSPTKNGVGVIKYTLWYTDDFKWSYEHP